MSKLEIPKAEPNGFVVTLNQFGYMTSSIDKYMHEFIQYSSISQSYCVDIGAAYGIASIAALKLGAKIIANDIDPRHLQLISDNISTELQKNLKLDATTFPKEMQFTKNSIGAFLIARVFHFLTPSEIMEGAQKLFQWLEPGGKVFLTAETPYLGLWKEFIPIYEKLKSTQSLWAGEIPDISIYAPHRSSELPKRMLLLDIESLNHAFSAAGFEIETLEYFSRPEFPEDIQYDGRESIGLICKKPT
jgi:Methyltransferase domain